MGMAASQARLLSITSRMSDNELKSQLINNAKMRLTTDSSKASEKYLAALNATQLMFSNYNLTGESQYQQLTFNNLTAYSAYNNQYGLVNRGGELLVSESDTAKYKAAFEKADADGTIEEGDIEGRNAKALEEFLKSYGLIQDTTYFENPEIYNIDKNIKEIYEGNMVFEYNNNGVNGMPQAERISGIHYGYDESFNTKDYGIYNTLLNNFVEADKVYQALVTEAEHNYIENLTHNQTGGGISGKNYAQTYKAVMEWYNQLTPNSQGTGYENSESNYGDPLAVAQAFSCAMQDFYNTIVKQGKFAEQPISYNALHGEGHGNAYADEVNSFHDRMQFYLDLGKPGSASGTYLTDPVQAHNRDGYTIDYNSLIEHRDENGNIDYYYYVIDENDAETYPESNPQTNVPEKEVNVGTDEDGNPITAKYPVYESIHKSITEAEWIDDIVEMYRFFQGEVLGELNRNAFKDDYVANYADDDKAAAIAKFDKAKADYEKAAKELSIFTFGTEIPENEWKYLTDLDWIIYGPLQDPNKPESDTNPRIGPKYPTTAIDGSEGGVDGTDLIDFAIAGSLEPGELPYRANFQVIKDIYLSEKMMEKYGTPKYTWIDINNPDENAEKKAAWYTNLFERMTQGGYETIENGLASSGEWLQFALESGLITMEQVDVKRAWVSTVYSNCSNITESQIDIDVTVAEAEYNKTMKEIEAKDKRYDIELKNIDTEHQSLQTEYDSIKSVIEKNVARNFKMFEA